MARIVERRWNVLAGVVGVVVALVGGALVAGASGEPSSAGGRSRQAFRDGAGRPCSSGTEGRREGTAIATAKLIIEYNSTDEDLGVHGAFDDHGWKRLCVLDPSGRPVLVVGPRNQMRDLAMAGIFFESREPPTAEFSFADLEAAFPEGEYAVRGESLDGTILVGSATLTHDVPAPPTISSPEVAREPRGAERNPVSLEDLVIEWARVTGTVAGGPVEIVGYEVIITKDVDDDPNGFSRPTYDVHLPATADRLGIPAEFLEANTMYELEVLALEASGNQSISVGFFKTA